MFNLMNKVIGAFVFLGLVFSTAVASERISGGIDLNHEWITSKLGTGWENCPIIPDDVPFNEAFPYFEIFSHDDPNNDYKWYQGFRYVGAFGIPTGILKFRDADPQVIVTYPFEEFQKVATNAFWYRGDLYFRVSTNDFTMKSLTKGFVNMKKDRAYTNGIFPVIDKNVYTVVGDPVKNVLEGITIKLTEPSDLNIDSTVEEFYIDLTEWYRYNNRHNDTVSKNYFSVEDEYFAGIEWDFSITEISAYHFILYAWNGSYINDNYVDDSVGSFVIGLGPYRTKDLEQRLWEFLNGIGNGFNGEPIPDFENPVEDPGDITVLFPDFQPEQTVMLGVNTTEARGGETLEVQVKVNDAESNPVLDAFGFRTKKIPERSKVYVLVVIDGQVLFAPGFTREMQGIDIVPGKGLYKVLTLPVPKGFGKTKAQWLAGVLDEDFNIIGDIHEVDTDIGD